MAKYRTAVFKYLIVAAGLLLPTAIATAQPGGFKQDGTGAGPRGRPEPPAPPGGVFEPGDTYSDRFFFIRDLGHRCLDFGGEAWWALGSPVYTYSCNGTIAQQVRVKEIDGTHDVKFLVGSRFCIGVRGDEVSVGRPLELQTCDDASPAQRFALDGDAILMGTQSSGRVSREFVIEPQNGYTTLRTPLVVGTRQASDVEYFRFEAVDRSGAFPTTGFVRVSSEIWLDWALSLGWGTVIEIDPAQPLELRGPFPKRINAGVTVRGYRKYTFQGPEIHTCVAPGEPMFLIAADDVRITGMRLRGPANDPRCRSSDLTETQAILITPTGGDAPRVPTAWVDRLDISYFTGSAVDTRGTDGSQSQTCPAGTQEFPRPTPVRVVGNFIHHNGAYGSVSGQGAFVLNQGNVFYRQHAHSIAADPWGTTGYHAYDNFFLSEQRDTHDVDMHGSLHPGHWYDGLSGDYFDVGWNTFLHTGHENINQRGTPCRFTAIHENVFLQSKSDSIVTVTTDASRHVTWDNAYGVANPTGGLAVGDFDGDGIDDIFVGTGQTWYFSSGGQAEWRFLSRKTDHARSLLFGDLDGDGRTDVIALHGGNIDVSWGGLSPWQTINVAAWQLSDMAVGDFDGDGKADLFLATGTQWFYAPGGRNWTPLAFSSYRRSDLLFGDFTRERRTHALRISQGKWQIAGLGVSWKPIGSAPVSSVAGLVVGDFNGDGFADVARTQFTSSGPQWTFATPVHSSGWTLLRPDAGSIGSHPIGRFNPGSTSDVLLWNSLHFSFAPSGRNPLQPLSRQDMR